MQAHDEMFDTQAAVDAAFADLDSLLAERQPAPASGVCCNCGGTVFECGQNAGKGHVYYNMCLGCGGVDTATAHPVLAARLAGSNYKRIHHFHERIAQLFLCESHIPDAEFLQIAERVLDGSYTVINKDVVREVLRSLKMQVYIERWLQIIHRITGIEPPKPGSQLLMSLDDAFTQLQRPFDSCKVGGRKNFLNYNYVFARLFQHFGCTQFGMFFPLIKSRPKLRILDETWQQMTASLGWKVTPLQTVAPFAVKLEQPALLLASIRLRIASATPTVTSTVPWKTESRKSDQRLLRELDRQTRTKQLRLGQSAPELQRSAVLGKRPRHAVEARLLSSRPLQCRR